LLSLTSAVNKESKKPLSPQEVRGVVSDILYPELKGKSLRSLSRAKLTEWITGELKNKAKSEKKKAPSDRITYQRLISLASTLNHELKEEEKLGYPEILKIVSETLYPELKAKSEKRYGKDRLRQRILEELRKHKKNLGCDVLALPEEIFDEGVNYFDIENHIQNVLPPCIYLLVNAGTQFGKTHIFNTRDFNYHTSGVAEITNRINTWLRSAAQRKITTDTIPMYFGEIQLRPGRKNNGDSENYYLEMILVVGDTYAEKKERIEIPRKKKTKAQKKKAKKNVEFVKERMKSLKAEKSKIKAIRQRISSEIYKSKIIIKERSIPKEIRDAYLPNKFKSEKAKIDKYLKNGTISRYQYNSLLQQLKEGYKQP
jgi:hypothetical protein